MVKRYRLPLPTRLSLRPSTIFPVSKIKPAAYFLLWAFGPGYLSSTRPPPRRRQAWCTPFSTISSIQPGWFLKDQNGNRIQDPYYPGDYVMDVGNPAYQQYCVNHAIQIAKQSGFDGIFLDDQSAALSWVDDVLESRPARS